MEFDKITHIDLGCSPAPLRIEDLLWQGVEHCVGIDRDLGPNNEDFMSMKWAWGIMEDECPVEYARWNMHDGPQVFTTKETEDRLIQGNVVDVLRDFKNEQIHVVYGDYFFHELDYWQRIDVRDQLDRILAPNGRILATIREGEESQGVMKIFEGGYNVIGQSWNYPLITNDQKYFKAIEGINHVVNVQIALLKCATAAR